MVIKKKYHFYAAHRNELLKDKCYNLHGHVYRFKVYVKTNKKEGKINVLFNDIDKYIGPMLESFDHGCFVHKNDLKLMKALEILGTKKYILDEPSSTEHIAEVIFHTAENLGLPIVKIELTETESSTVIYEP